MTLIHQLPQKVQKELEKKSLLKVISGLNNFDVNSVTMYKLFWFLFFAQISEAFSNNF